MKSFFHTEKEFSKRKYRLIAKRVITALLIMVLTISVISVAYSEDVSTGLAENLIRLHVVANSDLEEDQALKRDVRDRIIAYMKDKLQDSTTLEQTRQIIKDHLDDIEKVALTELQRQGKDYPVKAALGNFPFPTKVYGDIKLPAGNYEALRITLGKAEGANWWCVLFPPLCFVDASHGTVPDEVKEELKGVLSAEEYSIVTSADSVEDIPVRVKFKIVEFFQNSKNKVVGFLSKLFGFGN